MRLVERDAFDYAGFDEYCEFFLFHLSISKVLTMIIQSFNFVNIILYLLPLHRLRYVEVLFDGGVAVGRAVWRLYERSAGGRGMSVQQAGAGGLRMCI